jgi:hypothetical protein
MNITTHIAGFLSGMIGAMGMGGGGVLLIYLTAFAHVPQLKAQGINLISFLPTGLLATVIYAVKKQIVWKQVLLMWCGGAVAAAGGYLLAKFIETALLSKIFAAFLVTFGLYQLIFTGKNSQMNKNI